MTEYIEVPDIKDFKTVGKILRKKREEHSYTLEHVAEITRITINSLRSIEAGDLDTLPDIVFVRGFVRNYANLLGIESDWMVQVLNLSQDTSGELSLDHEYQEEDGNAFTNLFQEKNYLVLGGLFLVLVLVILFINLSSKMNPDEAQVIQALEQQNTPNQKSTGEEAKNAKAAATAMLSPLNLTLLANENDWVNLLIDSKTAHQVHLEKGRKYEWPAQEAYELTMSTGTSAKIFINGEEIHVPTDQANSLFEIKLDKSSLTQLNQSVK